MSTKICKYAYLKFILWKLFAPAIFLNTLIMGKRILNTSRHKINRMSISIYTPPNFALYLKGMNEFCRSYKEFLIIDLTVAAKGVNLNKKGVI